MQYNVENLFDTIPSLVNNDEDFTPTGKNHWTSSLYWKKLGRLARVIAAAGGATPIDLVGMVEVENDSVLYDLTHRTSLSRLGYDFCITHGSDRRGINVALLYQPAKFKVLRAASLPIVPPAAERPTRDILKVEGVIPTFDTLSVFVAHMPSRRGEASSEVYRAHVAETLRLHIDSMMAERPSAKIVVMGDMNADVADLCLSHHLGVKNYRGDDSLSQHSLYAIPKVSTYDASVKGTYFFQNQWSDIDHIFVSADLLRGASVSLAKERCRIFDAPFLLDFKRKMFRKVVYPKRTFLGGFYNGGCSDHLPIVLHFELNIH